MRRLCISSAILVTTLGLGTALAQQPHWPGSKPTVPATTTQQTTTTTTTTTPRWPGTVRTTPQHRWPTVDQRREHERLERERRARWEQERRERERRDRWEHERRERERREAYARRDHDRRPPGWSKGKKTGWGNCDLPPGQAKKHGCEARDWHHDRDHDRDVRVADRRVPRWPGRH